MRRFERELFKVPGFAALRTKYVCISAFTIPYEYVYYLQLMRGVLKLSAKIEKSVFQSYFFIFQFCIGKNQTPSFSGFKTVFILTENSHY